VKYDRTVMAYHGCDAATAERLLAGEPFRASENDYDWLGSGIYFWEYGVDRALRFAHEQKRRGKVQHPAVVGAIVQLGNCFDLMDTFYTSRLPAAFAEYRRFIRAAGLTMARNAGKTPDLLLRRRDCAVLNFYLGMLEEEEAPHDTVRCAFIEGRPAFLGSGIRRESHVQIAVRNPACILGVFRPMMAT
jgi:hypothetical protein